jgi:DNA-binding CsgD family transcriptional regulator/PAS domain-containing protein
MLSELVGDIYDAALDPTLWTRALERSCCFVGGASAVLFWHDVVTESSAALHVFNEDPHYTKLYFETYLPMNPVLPAASFVEPGLIYTPTDIVPKAELIATRFHKEWVEPQGIVDVVCVNLQKDATCAAMLNIRRDETQGIVDDEARRRAALIVPHFQRAVSIGRSFVQHRTSQSILTDTLEKVEAGVFLLEPNGRIVFVNESGRAMLDEGVLLRASGGSLMAVESAPRRALQHMVAATDDGDWVAGVRGAAIALSTSPRQRWFAQVVPLTSGDRKRAGALYSAAAAVFVLKTSPARPPPLEALARLHGLTASEVRVLDAVTKVSGVRAAADLLGLSQATVKTHLQNLFRKTGVARQSELVKLVAGFERSAPD